MTVLGAWYWLWPWWWHGSVASEHHICISIYDMRFDSEKVFSLVSYSRGPLVMVVV